MYLVVPVRRSSSDVEFEDFKVAVSNHHNQVVQTEKIEDEIISYEKKCYHKASICKQPISEPYSTTFDFQEMQKIPDFKPSIIANENNSGSTDQELIEFAQQYLITSKNCEIIILHTEEHGDFNDAVNLQRKEFAMDKTHNINGELEDNYHVFNGIVSITIKFYASTNLSIKQPTNKPFDRETSSLGYLVR